MCVHVSGGQGKRKKAQRERKMESQRGRERRWSERERVNQEKTDASQWLVFAYK